MVGLCVDVVFHGDGGRELDEGFIVDLVFWLNFVGKVLFSEVEDGFGEVAGDFVELGEVGWEFGLFAGEVVLDPKRK